MAMRGESSLVQINRQRIIIDAALNASCVNIVDLQGRIVKSSTVTCGLGSMIDFDALHPGCYMIVIIADGVKVYDTKIIVAGNR